MANKCVYIPEKGTALFLKLKENFGQKMAERLYLKAINPRFKQDYKKSLTLNSEGFPTYESLTSNTYIKKFIGDKVLAKAEEKKFGPLKDTFENYESQLNTAKAYNENNKDFTAFVEKREGEVYVKIVTRDEDSLKIFNNQYGVLKLNKRLEEIFKPVGITMGRLTEAEECAGRVGVVDFSKAKEIAKDFSSLIRVSNNMEGFNSVSEEFSHVILATISDSPLVSRNIEILKNDEGALKEILGNEYEDNLKFHNNDKDRLAFEALGKLLQKNLLSSTIETPAKNKTLLGRLIDKIRSMFKRFSLEEISNAVIQAETDMGNLARTIVKNGMSIDRKQIVDISQTGEYNSLSNLVDRNIEILKQARETEAKKEKIFHTDSLLVKDRLKMLEEFSSEDTDTVMGICYYAKLALKEMKELNDQFTLWEFFESDKDRFRFLRQVRDYNKSFSPFIQALNESMSLEGDNSSLYDKKKIGDDEVDVKTMIKQLNDLDRSMQSNFNVYGRRLFMEFLAPYFGHGGRIVVPFGKNKGEVITLENLMEEASGDISMFDRWLDSMDVSSDIMLQMFDKAVKEQKDLAREKTKQDVRAIQNLMLDFERLGITDFDWMLEKYNDGKKTGNYIDEVNYSQYYKDRAEFMKYLEDKYGKVAYDENAKKKIEEKNQWHTEHSILTAEGYIPNPKTYENKVYTGMPEAQRVLYNKFLAIKQTADNLLPVGKTYNLNAVQIRKSGTQRLFDSFASENSIIDNIKGQIEEALFDRVDDDQEFGVKTGLVGFDGKEYMTLPVMYVSKLENPDELSTDVFSCLMSYCYMANNYKALSEIVDPLEVGRIVLNEKRKINTLRGGKPLIEKMKNHGIVITSKMFTVNDSNIQQKLDDFFECQVYGRHLKDSGSIEILGKQLNKNKLANVILKYSSLAQLGFNWMANIANVTTGLAMQNIEAAACEYFTPKQLMEADTEYAKMLGKYITEIGSRFKTNKLYLFDELIEFKQDYKERLFKNKKKSILHKVFGENIAFIGQDAGDHWLYNRTAIAVCKNRKVILPDGTKTNLWEALDIRETFKGNEKIKEMYLPEGTRYEDGSLVFMSKVGREILHINQSLFGVYNEDDTNAANRVIIGRLLLQYKKWMKPQFNKRFQKGIYNATMDSWEEGYYNTLLRITNELFRGKYQIGALNEQLKDHEKKNINRAIFEMIQCFGIYALVCLVDWPDDKDRPHVQKLAEYVARRLSHELGTLTPIVWVPGSPAVPMLQENLKTLKTPMASASAIQNLANLIGSALHPSDWNNEIQSGTFKGKSTLYKNFMKAPIPGVAQYTMLERYFDDLDKSIDYYVRAY